MEALGPALKHHYKENDHHPEHFKNGVNDMNIFQILEMLCDWYISSGISDSQNPEEDIKKLMEKNCKRFKIEKPLSDILEKTMLNF